MRDKAINGLGTLAALGNEAAIRGLSEFLKALPVASNMGQAHLKKGALSHLVLPEARGSVVPHLIDEPSRTPLGQHRQTMNLTDPGLSGAITLGRRARAIGGGSNPRPIFSASAREDPTDPLTWTLTMTGCGAES